MIRKGETVNSLSNYDSINNAVQLRDHSRKNLKRLGVLYSDTDQISSPIQRTEENFCEKNEGESSTRQVKKFSKLISLASDINSWDDDYSHHPLKNVQQQSTASPRKTGAIPKTNFSSPAKTQSSPLKALLPQSKQTAGPSNASPSSKKLLWDKKVMDSLEAQGFSRRDTTGPKLVYDYSNEKPSTCAAAKISSPQKSTPVTFPLKSTATFVKPSGMTKVPTPTKEAPKPLPSKIAAAQKSVRSSNLFQKNQKDPADLSLKDRMAIFEKNKGTAPVPKTPYGITDANPIRSNMPELSKKFNFGFGGVQQNRSSPVKEPAKEKVPENAAANIKTTVSKLLTGKEMTISEKQISDEIRKQRDAEMKCIMNRFNKQPEPDTSEDEVTVEKGERKRSSSGEKYLVEATNEEVYQKADDKKRSRVSNPSRLYPVLSDIESSAEVESNTEADDNYTTATVSESEDAHQPMDDDDDDDYTDDEDMNMSFGREILNSVRKNNDLAKDDYLDSTVTSTEVSDAMGDMDDYLNEALEGNESKDYDDKGSACSDSFQYERYPKRVSFKDVATDIPIKSKLEISPAKKPNGPMTLVHTVSFYRRQQSASASNTPVKKVIHKDSSDDEEIPMPSVSRKAREECDNKIQRLLDEVMRQQTIISQTSQALNLCASTVEFSGSTEAVEGERHLLVATNRRIACLNEVQRLKVEGMLCREGMTKEKGSLTIQEIIIPMKQTYISRLAGDEINGHHLLCLVKYNEFVLATKTLPTLPGLKSVKFQDLLSLNEVYADFKITLEIYGMTAQREILPHDIKYHIQTPNKKRFKSKLQESNMSRPLLQSPGGPNAVRTPALVQYGYIIFSMREIKQKSWVINETAPGVSPLNGNVYLKIDSKITVDVDHCGFLTMFDDISGFGAWHRRWCRLSSNTLYYWKYPEDEKKKEALGQLDLTNIVSEKADVAPRTICARLHTILLESKRGRRSDDVESLVLVPKGNQTTVR
jgi:actin-binding protein anillin